MADKVDVLDHFLAEEASVGSPCQITVRRLNDGRVSARMTFAPGMASAAGTGSTVAEAMDALAATLVGSR